MAVPSLRVSLLGPSLLLSEAAAAALSAISPAGVEVLRDIAEDNRHPAGATARQALAARDALSSAVASR